MFFSFTIIPYIGFFALSWIYTEKFIILATSFLGSYRFVRGISLFAGGFPNETEIYSKFAHYDKIEPHFPKWFYAYMIAIMIIFVMTSYF